MKNLPFFVPLLLLLLVCSWIDGCSTNQPSVRVINGSKVPESEARFVVWVFSFTLMRKDKSINDCAGTLISPRTVLTSAQCFEYGKTPTYVSVNYGSHNYQNISHSKHIVAESVLIHPGFNESTSKNDLAIVTLRTAVKPGPNVQFVQLDTDPLPQCCTTVSVYGWGDDSGKGIGPDLLKGQFQVSRTDICNAMMVSAGLPPNNDVYCAGDASQTNNLTSLNLVDLGGPMISKSGKLVGVAAQIRVDQKLKPNGPVVSLYTKVISHLEWINKNTKN